MRRIAIYTVTFACLATVPLPGSTTFYPTGEICAADACSPLTAVFDGKIGTMNPDIRTATFHLQGEANFNTDPYIAYGFAITNLTGSPLTFTIVLTTPYVGGTYNSGKSSHSASVIDSGTVPDGSVTVTAAAGGVHQPSYDLNPFGAIAGGCALTGSPGFGNVCPATTIPYIALSPISALSGTLKINLGGTVSPNDIYVFSGRAEIFNTEVPEPASLWICSTVFAGTVARRWLVRARRG